MKNFTKVALLSSIAILTLASFMSLGVSAYATNTPDGTIKFLTYCGYRGFPADYPVGGVNVTITWSHNSKSVLSNGGGLAEIKAPASTVVNWTATYPQGGVLTGSLTSPASHSKATVKIYEPISSSC